MPTLVLWGDADRALPAPLLDGLDELVGDLTVERIERGTHWVAHEEPHAIAKSIADYLLG